MNNWQDAEQFADQDKTRKGGIRLENRGGAVNAKIVWRALRVWGRGVSSQFSISSAPSEPQPFSFSSAAGSTKSVGI